MEEDENCSSSWEMCPIGFEFTVTRTEERNIHFLMSHKTYSLKVPLHQIKSAWMWYGWFGIDEYRRWRTDFLISSLFLKFKLNSLSCILLTCSALHAILGFRICMWCSSLHMPRIAAIILFIFESFSTAVPNELRLTDKKFLIVIKKGSLFA